MEQKTPSVRFFDRLYRLPDLCLSLFYIFTCRIETGFFMFVYLVKEFGFFYSLSLLHTHRDTHIVSLFSHTYILYSFLYISFSFSFLLSVSVTRFLSATSLLFRVITVVHPSVLRIFTVSFFFSSPGRMVLNEHDHVKDNSHICYYYYYYILFPYFILSHFHSFSTILVPHSPLLLHPFLQWCRN